ncbi:MAG: DNA starvation/stationary phase protection protein [Bacteroidetes bacterium]|nr:DNA starvation/stationary phase protection protein [Bacteroidota bacterium]
MNNEKIVKKLNQLLAAYQVVYFNTRASHWLIKGENFFELHAKFEEQYNDATEKIDEIAERILTHGGVPLTAASEMVKTSAVKEAKVNGDQAACVKGLLDDLSKLGVIENELAKIADDANDIVTADMMTRFLSEQQKTRWMLSQFLNKKSSVN